MSVTATAPVPLRLSNSTVPASTVPVVVRSPPVSVAVPSVSVAALAVAGHRISRIFRGVVGYGAGDADQGRIIHSAAWAARRATGW